MSLETDNSYFKKIAMSLSGGGARAAGFHLGTLLYLDHIDLLRNVKILSSVSGGSFVNAKYSLTLKQEAMRALDENREHDLHETFRRFYTEFRTYLLDSKLIFNAFKELAKRSNEPSNSLRRQTMITALADAYHRDDNFLQKASFGIFWEKGDIHLEHIIFNVTEFKTGLSFRFMKCPAEDEKVFDDYCGSAKVPLPLEMAREARLADIVASSSCIPVGMEPVLFPDDYEWQDPNQVAKIKRFLHEVCEVKSIPFMDGGIYDNQGIDSVLFAMYRSPEEIRELRKVKVLTARIISEWGDSLRKKAAIAESKAAESNVKGATRTVDSDATHDVDLFIISDTPVPNTNILKLPEATPKTGLRLRNLNTISLVLIWTGLLVFAVNAYQMYDDFRLPGDMWDTGWMDRLLWPALKLALVPVWVSLLYLLPIVFALALVGGTIFLRSRVSKLQRNVEGGLSDTNNSGKVERSTEVVQFWKNFGELRLSELSQMVSMRISSLVALTDQVFFNRVRALNYSLVKFNPTLKGKVISHEIFDLTAREKQHAEIDPTNRMYNIVKAASTMETRIWFKSDEEIDWIIATGQITMCYNLIEFLLDNPEPKSASYNALLQAALADWAKLRDDPYAFMRKFQKPGQVSVESPAPAESYKTKVATQTK